MTQLFRAERKPKQTGVAEFDAMLEAYARLRRAETELDLLTGLVEARGGQDGERVQGGASSPDARLLRYLDSLGYWRDKQKQVLDDIGRLYHDIERVCRLMEDSSHADIVRRRYLYNTSVETLASEGHYSRRHVYRMLEDAAAAYRQAKKKHVTKCH